MAEQNDASRIQALQTELTFYKQAQNYGHIGTWHWDIPNNSIQWSDNVSDLFGLHKDDFDGTFEAFQNLLPESERAYVNSHIQNCLSGKEPNYHIHYRIIWPDGSIHWLEAWGGAIFSDDGTAISMTGSVIDVTNRETIERALLRITQNTAAKTGDDFFRILITELADTLEADYAFIGQLDATGKSVQTTTTYALGKIVDNFSYSLEHAPCAKVIKNQSCIYKSNVQKSFPEDELLIEMGIEAYIGTALQSEDNTTCGLIVVLFKRPVPNADIHGLLLETYAPMVFAELERMSVSSKLQESEQRYKHLIEAAPEAIIVLDVETGLFVESNAAAEKLYKLDKQALRTLGPVELSPAFQENGTPSAVLAQQMIERALSGETVDFEYEHINSKKELVYCQIKLQKILEEHKPRIRATILDISDRKKAVEALRNNEENLRTTLDAIADAVIATDKNGLIDRINPKAAELLACDPHQIIGQHINNFIRLFMLKEDVTIEDSLIEFSQLTKRSQTQEAYYLKNKSNQQYIISCNAAEVANFNQESSGLVIVIRDITKQRELENQLRQAQKMESIGQLAGGIAHDFNNMLAGIMATSELLLVNSNDKKQNTFIQNIIDTAQRAGDLTQQLLSFSRKGKLSTKTFDGHVAINNMVTMLNRSIDKRISITCQYNAEQSNIRGDQSQIESALLNLGINARDAMPNGGEITFSTTCTELSQEDCEQNSFQIEPGTFFHITVKDTGFGIPEEILPLVFEPFFTTKGVGQGTGLGLSAVYGCICDHFGMIHIESKEHKGTSVHIYVPIQQQKTDSHINTKIDKVDGSGNILLIDDEETIRSMASELLDQLGYQVTTAQNGSTGINLLKENPNSYDVILLDMVMPDKNGSEVFSVIQSLNDQIPVILMSGYTQDYDIDALIKSGASSFIQKPFRLKTLSEAIERVLK